MLYKRVKKALRYGGTTVRYIPYLPRLATYSTAPLPLAWEACRVPNYRALCLGARLRDQSASQEYGMYLLGVPLEANLGIALQEQASMLYRGSAPWLS